MHRKSYYNIRAVYYRIYLCVTSIRFLNEVVESRVLCKYDQSAIVYSITNIWLANSVNLINFNLTILGDIAWTMVYGLFKGKPCRSLTGDNDFWLLWQLCRCVDVDNCCKYKGQYYGPPLKQVRFIFTCSLNFYTFPAPSSWPLHTRCG